MINPRTLTMQSSSEITYIHFIVIFFFMDSISKIRHRIRNHNCLEHASIRCNTYEREMKSVKEPFIARNIFTYLGLCCLQTGSIVIVVFIVIPVVRQ